MRPAPRLEMAMLPIRRRQLRRAASL